MKKRIWLLFLFCLSTVLLMNGQATFGGFIGLNNGKLSGDAPNKAKYKNKIGINAGIFMDVRIDDVLSLSVQPSYSQEGTRLFYKVAGQTDQVDSISVGLDYFSLPVLVKIEATNKRFYAVSGIETAFLQKSTQTIAGEQKDLDVEIQDINIAMHIGAGLHIPVGRSQMFVELRYSQGLTNLTNEPFKEGVLPRVKTSGAKIFVGYTLPTRKNKN